MKIRYYHEARRTNNSLRLPGRSCNGLFFSQASGEQVGDIIALPEETASWISLTAPDKLFHVLWCAGEHAGVGVRASIYV